MRLAMDESWLTAGAFARRSRLSARALGLYATTRLLVPARIDESSGYRLYHESQLRDARLICMLRRADVPLALVADILAAPRGQRRALIDDHRDDVERSIHYRRELLGHLARTISGRSEERRVGTECRASWSAQQNTNSASEDVV